MRAHATPVIVHRLSGVEPADRVPVSVKGRIISAGRQAKPRARRGARVRFPELQFKVKRGIDVRD